MFRTNICVCVLFLLACCALPLAAQEGQPQVTTYYACINNSTGAIRIVSKSTECMSAEHKINWNQVGPQGPHQHPFSTRYCTATVFGMIRSSIDPCAAIFSSVITCP